MIEINDNGQWRVQFESPMEMADWLEKTPARWPFSTSKGGSRDYQWDLGAGYADAVRLARDGWPEGVQRILANVATLPQRARPERVYDVAGDFADAPRAAAGDPFNMVQRGSGHRNRPIMTIGVDTMAAGGTRAEILAMFGAALVAVIDRLENKGVRVELYGHASFTKKYGGAYDQRISWLVKGAGDSLDLSSVAFGIGHPAMLRRLAFATCERSDPKNACSSYGGCGTISRSGFVDIAEDALLVGGVGTSFYRGEVKTMADMVRYAENQLNAASIKLTGEPIAELEEIDA